MKFETAKKLMKATMELDVIFNEMSLLLDEIEDLSEKRELATSIGSIGVLYISDIQMEIVRQYKELDPDNDHY